VYRLECRIKDTWIPLKNYSNLSKLKAEFLISLCEMRDREKAKSIRVVEDDR